MRWVQTYKHLSIADTNILKGFAILLIGFHNFFNNIEFFSGFGINEFYFAKGQLHAWLAYLSYNPFEWFVGLLTFMGHYGVSAFVLISGYGLAMGFKNKTIRLSQFYLSRLKKIYPTFFLGVVIAVIIALLFHRYTTQSELWESVFWKLSLLSPFNSKMLFALYGPWWFFGLIFQLYALFPLLLFLLKKNLNVLFWSLLGVLFVLPHTGIFLTNENYYASALYQLPIFGLGVFLGYQNELKLPRFLLIPALFCLLYGQGNFVIWKFTHLSAAVLIFLFVIFIRNKQWRVNKILTICGVLSLHFFVIHPIIRPPFVELADSVHSIYFTTALSFVYVAVGFGLAWVFRLLDNRFKRWVFKELA